MISEISFVLNGELLFYRTAGEGHAVVLVHGFAEDGLVWKEQIAFLQEHFRLIIPDMPGTRASSPVKEWTMEYFADCLLRVLDEEKIEKAILIGHSMGGYICLAFGEKYPERTQALGLFHSTALPDSEEKKNIRRRGIEFIREYGAAKFLEQTTPNLFSPAFRQEHPETVQELIDRYAHFTDGALIQYYEAMMLRPDRTPFLKTFPRPVLFVIGEQDAAVPMAQVLPQTYLPAISVVEIFKDSAHIGMLEETAKANQVLLQFCRQAEQSLSNS